MEYIPQEIVVIQQLQEEIIETSTFTLGQRCWRKRKKNYQENSGQKVADFDNYCFFFHCNQKKFFFTSNVRLKKLKKKYFFPFFSIFCILSGKNYTENNLKKFERY